MEIRTDYVTDIGTRKAVNQDSLLIKDAKIENIGRATMGVLCDGMGGLSSGEIASATFVKKMSEWFDYQLPEILKTGGSGATEQLSKSALESPLKDIEYSLKSLAEELNQKIQHYGAKREIRLGTTAVVALILNDTYLVMNVGDSRAYIIAGTELLQITHDQSYVQQQMDLGLMTIEEAMNSNKKSILLQCVGASEFVVPDFFQGKMPSGSHFLLCTDGFWRKLEKAELAKNSTSHEGLLKLIDLVKDRGETDNITALTIEAD